MVDFDKMSDEELLELLRKARTAEPAEPKKPPEKINVKLSDGSVVEAENVEELNRLLIAKLEEYRQQQASEPQPPPKGPGETAKPEWNYDKFANTFVKDPREGLEYLDQAEFGFSTRKAVPVLLAGLNQLLKKVQELETQRFLDLNPEYEPSPENRRVVEGIMTERGWQPSYGSFQDAFDIARARGLVKTKEKEKEKEEPFVPPRTSARSSEPGGDSADELLAAAYSMPMDKLEEILAKAGVLKR